MYFPYSPRISRIFNVLLIGGVVLLLSCQSNPIILNPPGGYEYISQTFQLDTENSYSVQGDAHTGHSPRLYSGILNNRDTVYALIKLMPDILDSHQVCDPATDVMNIILELTSTNQIAVKEDSIFIDTLFQMGSLKSYLISENDIMDIDEDDNITTEILTQILNSPMKELPLELKEENSIQVNLFDKDTTILDRWCEDHEALGIIISYSPSAPSRSYLEFYSSDEPIVGLGPKLSLEYSIKEEISRSYNYYSINSVTWSDAFIDIMPNFYNSSLYYVDDSLSVYWGTVYALNLDEDAVVPINYDSISIYSDIIPEAITSTTLLMQINIKLDSVIINNGTDSIIFSLTNTAAFRSDVDPAGDNVGTTAEGTENNIAYDESELFNDYGLDNCPDEMEKGNSECADSKEGSAFNSTGTEGNKQRDWIDYNDNGKWDPNEGEMWGDWGFDWCPDSLEDGNGGCLIEPSIIPLGYDPNQDNIDSKGDDWHEINNPDSTEGNHKWDPGELFYDWGSDGLPESLMGYKDETEGNNVYNEGEQFDDTGSDGLYNINEPGYNTNRTEGNNQFDDEGEFIDCGDDNCCDSDDDKGICDDAEDDNYNIDPNEDNWNDCGSDGICPLDDDYLLEDIDETEGNEIWDEHEGTEKNVRLDFTDSNDENGIWDEGEGEEWFDWGLDGIRDDMEAFQMSSVLFPNLYDNNYMFDIAGGLLQETPGLVDSMVNLWISKIEKTGDNEIVIDISIQSNVALKGLQLQLSHSPYTRVDTVLKTYEPSISKIGTGKLFSDLSLFPKKMYSKEELDKNMLIDYANDVSLFLDFDSLDIFLKDEENIISHENCNLVLYIDSANTNIYTDMWVYISHTNSSEEDEILITKKVTSLSDSIEISIGHVLRAYQSGNLEIYDKFKLMAGGNLYNYSQLSIQNNPQLYLMYTK